ncbi:DUF6233 domain-containing protein [Streptomyces sp. NPDC088350]|uniref:DUF6233 domain-containing protein n=1 Tax=Streptomyces sp. NPDC088350 TaxID=3365854 RepID=UPI00380590C4
MNDLPPDLPRLRVILAYLDQQLTEQETIGIYLRLQRRDVERAIAHADRAAIPRSSLVVPTRPPSATRAETGDRPSSGYVLERRDRRDATKGAVIHVADCDRTPHDVRPVEPGLARKVLTNDRPFFDACEFCRPDTELGIDLD